MFATILSLEMFNQILMFLQSSHKLLQKSKITCFYDLLIETDRDTLLIIVDYKLVECYNNCKIHS